jgi:hypothetical protein
VVSLGFSFLTFLARIVGMATTDPSRVVLRQLAATLAYRAAKVLRDAPPEFGHRAFGDATRQPVRIVAHMADLMTWGVSMAAGGKEWKAEGGDDWTAEVDRFFTGLAALDAAIATDGPFAGSIEKLIQGPFADALTHVGQLSMLRGMAGAPVRPESYARAKIEAGRVGLDQAPPGFEFDGDASARK